MNSIAWLKGNFKNQYTKIAQEKKLRSRAWFKLEAIDRIDVLLHVGMTVVDLGSSPGGWSLYVKNKVGNTGNVIACDLLPMQSIVGVDFFKGDCTDTNFLEMLFIWIKNKKVHVVLSDMSPDISGISVVDISKSIYLGNLALYICKNILIDGGAFLVKIFQGIGFNEYLRCVRRLFSIVKVRKPYASRSCSREVYIVAKNYKKL